MSKSRNWVFTQANPEGLLDYDEMEDIVKYLVYQEEVSESGLRHFQGYMELSSPRGLSTLMELIPGAHFEVRRGTSDQARAYAMKAETRVDGPWEHGVYSVGRPGQRTDILSVKKKLDEGSSIEEIAQDPEHFPTWLKYSRAIQEYKRMRQVNRQHKTTVYLLYGPPGTGKSKWAMDNYPDAYWKQRSNWWCGYAANETVVLDDYYGWLPFDTLLRLMDRYPMMCETKGGQTTFLASTIVITSNKLPHEWYKGNYNFEALYRRVDHFIVYEQHGEITTVEECNLSTFAADTYAKRHAVNFPTLHLDGQAVNNNNNNNQPDNNS